MKPLFFCVTFMLFTSAALSEERYSYETALNFYNQQNYATAFIHLRNVLHEQPENLPAKLLLSSVLYQQGHFYEAGYLYNEALVEGADINLVLPELLSCYQISNQHDAILELGKYANMTDKNRFNWLLSAFFVHAQRQDSDAAQQTLSEAEQINGSQKHLILNAKATLAMTQVNLSEASRLVQDSLDENAEHAATWRLKGDIFRQQQSFESALSAYQQAYKIAPHDPANMRSLSAALIASGNIESGKELMQVMQNLGLNDTYIRFANSFILSLQQDNAPAVADLQSLHADLTALPMSYFELQPDQLFVRASVGYLLGNVEQALRDFEWYLQRIPGDSEALIIAAEIYRTSRDRSQTLRFLEQHQPMVQLSPQLIALHVKTVFELERLQQAEKLVTEARSLYPDDEPLLLLDAQIKARLHGVDYARQLLQRSSGSASPGILLRQALLALDMQELESASHYAQQLLELKPSADNLNLLASIQLKAGNLESAQQQLDQLFNLAPKHFPGLLTQANIYYQRQQLADAASLLQSLLDAHPRHLQTTTLMAAVEISQDKNENAESRLNELLNRQHFKPAVLILTKYYLNRGQFSLALSTVQRALRRDFMAVDLLLLQADIHIRMGEIQLAMDTIKILESLPEMHVETLYNIAKLYISMHELAIAETRLQQLVTKSPNTLLYQLEHIQVKLVLQQFPSAKQLIDSLKVKLPNSADLLLLEATYHLLASMDDEKAFSLFNLAVEQDEHFRRAWTNLYELARQPKFRDRFISIVQAGLQVNPVNGWLRRLLAEHYMNHQMFKEAQPLYLALLEQSDFINDALLLNNLAITLLEQDPEQAIVYAKQAVLVTPNHPGRLTTFANALVNNKQFAEALPTLRQAHSLDSGNQEVNYLTAICLLELQRQPEAVKILEQIKAQVTDKVFASKAAVLLSKL